MADIIKNVLWTLVLLLALTFAMDVAGITLHDDYDGKQIIDQIECQNQNGKLTLKPNGILFQESLVCENGETQ